MSEEMPPAARAAPPVEDRIKVSGFGVFRGSGPAEGRSVFVW